MPIPPHPDVASDAISPRDEIQADPKRRILDDWFNATYKELKRLASAVKHNDPNATISTSTLVHEAWIKLAASPNLAPQSELHFKRIAAKAMRQIVIGAGRRRRASRRGGGLVLFVTLHDFNDAAILSNDGLVRLGDALNVLETNNPRQAELVDLRFFGGYDVAEAATMLGIAEATALLDWRVAKAWLAAEIRKS